MGIPKFYRWISERYPKINQRIGSGSPPDGYGLCYPGTDIALSEYNDADGSVSVFGVSDVSPIVPNVGDDDSDNTDKFLPPLSAMRPPASPPPYLPTFDRLYLDMNGILHGCSHANVDRDLDVAVNIGGGATTSEKTEAIIMQNIVYYVDRIVSTVRPREVLYLAVDGVAPRAKLNQQRSRRFRARKDYLDALEKERRGRRNLGGDVDDFASVKEMESGGDGDDHDATDDDGTFHSNAITPGTPFMDRVSEHLIRYIRQNIRDNPNWRDLTVYFSGSDVPGEGEHKIMSFIRNARKAEENYDPNKTHCIHGQDGDLLLLALATHEPNFCLLREEVLFNVDYAAKRGLIEMPAVEDYVLRSQFELLHVNVLRDYLELDLIGKDRTIRRDSNKDKKEQNEPDRLAPESHEQECALCLERTIDDFVFMTFFIGNDFLPHLSSLDIENKAFDHLFQTYRVQKETWITTTDANSIGEPYLTRSGKILCGRRLESFLQAIAGKNEIKHFNNRSIKDVKAAKVRRMLDKKLGWKTNDAYLPSPALLAKMEATHRKEYQEMLRNLGEELVRDAVERHGFQPVLAGTLKVGGDRGEDTKCGKGSATTDGGRRADTVDSGASGGMEGAGILEKIAMYLFPINDTNGGGDDKRNKLHSSTPGPSTMKGEDEVEHLLPDVDEGDYKGRYYYDKLKFTPLDIEKHRALRKAYLEGLVWNLEYYYGGCVSWSWYYPYHYGPMLSDIIEIDDLLSEIKFDMGEPLRPFEQLLGCMPPSSAYLLPKPYRKLMTSENSPIKHFYPKDFKVDMNGKRNPWEGVAVLPFIDIDDLVSAVKTAVPEEALTVEEQKRNRVGQIGLALTWDENEETDLPPLPYSTPGFGPLTKCSSRCVPFDNYRIDGRDRGHFCPEILPGTPMPHPHFSTLSCLEISTITRKSINVFGNKSRYSTRVITATKAKSYNLPPASLIAPQFIGTFVHINYPYLQEALVTAVSDSESIMAINLGICDHSHLPDYTTKIWTLEESLAWAAESEAVHQRLSGGEGVPGTGGYLVAHSYVMLKVRPLQRIETLENGAFVKVFSREEMDVPLMAAMVSPIFEDPRLQSATHIAIEMDMNSNISSFDPSMFESVENVALKVNDPHLLKTAAVGPPLTCDNATAIGCNVQPLSRMISPTPLMQPSKLHKRQRQFFASNPFREYHTLLISSSGRQTVHPMMTKKYVSETLAMRTPNRRSHRQNHSCQIVHNFIGGKQSRCCSRHGLFRAAATAIVLAGGGLWRDTCAADWSGRNCNRATVLRRNFFGSTMPGRQHFFWPRFHGSDDDGGEYLDYPVRLEGENSVPNAPVDDATSAPPLKFAHGTTTLAFIFKGGIIVAVDSRASIGQFIGSKTTQKVLPVSSHILGTMAGGER
uniref:Uncharacterized protein n=1 Tax=Corethron hystrix TaxID=216773 RepID=A0A7S1FZ16_9STRA|mmetsp:Transcript_38718/g.90006  ORF Transcript_38718/g.90006 Transcript_38718/m.90006 type:complete len:1391 (+) Transcript_38718:79-4251(+)